MGEFKVVGLERAPFRLGAIPAGYAWVADPNPVAEILPAPEIERQLRIRVALIEARARENEPREVMSAIAHLLIASLRVAPPGNAP